MIDYGKIKTISAQKGILDIVVEKDYILDWVLWGISQNEYLKDTLAFKGGTALHKMYFTDWRFSEDLDFTTINQVGNEGLSDAIGKLCEKVRKQSEIDLRQKNINPSGKEDSEWSFEVKIEYYGPRGRIRETLPTILLHITNDEILMDKPLIKTIITPYEDLPANFAILTYSLEEILAEKIRTILHQRCWPRDIYDTWRLLREVKNIINSEKVLDIYYRKSLYRKSTPGIPADIDERILRIKNQWPQGLQRQISTPPDFDKVYPEIIELLKKLFNYHAIIKSGGVTMLETHYSIKYKNGDTEIEVQGDKAFVEEKFKELLGLKFTNTSPEVIKSETAYERGKEISLGEFLKSKTLKTHSDKMLVFGYFLEKIKGYTSFNLNDIELCYRDARLQRTKNFGPYIAYLIRDNYLIDGEKKDGKKAWQLTKTGYKYVEDLGPEDVVK